ncbi:hypothetical protein GPECTOR_9g651 [Gonium pectorale]|uniref:Pherophorin domain-containing protein n=1 Tax=Gonium pectorale TaxID=33097 RepID=A0A150GRY6_GONPE|nr:hypothetical protein GPECTOR_9g651 [Gonium pectorale]|eukprot:KXZ52606.1 hypothetical protein GPECTOR_9g651 [Gonium pectorale]
MDPAVLGSDLDVASVLAARELEDGGEVAVTVIPYTQAAIPTVTVVDTIAPGAAAIYVLTWRKLTTTPSGGGARRLAQAAVAPQTRAPNSAVLVWNNETVSSTVLPSESTGPTSQALAAGAATCVPGASPSTLPTILAPQPLLGALGCLQASIARTFSTATNKTVVNLSLRGGNGTSTAGAAACALWLASLPQPVFVRMLVNGDAAAALQMSTRARDSGAGTAGAAFAYNSAIQPLGAFLLDSATVLPRASALQLAARGGSLSLSLPDALSLADVCSQGALAGQLPNTCAIQIVTSSGCAQGVVAEVEAGSGGVGDVPVVASAPPSPPSTLQEAEPGGQAGAPAVASRSGLSNVQIAIVVCFVAGFVLLAVIVTALVAHYRRKRWSPSKSELDGEHSSIGTMGHVIDIRSSTGGAANASDSNLSNVTVPAPTPATPSRPVTSGGAVEGGRSSGGAGGVSAGGAGGSSGDAAARTPDRRAHFINPLSMLPVSASSSEQELTRTTIVRVSGAVTAARTEGGSSSEPGPSRPAPQSAGGVLTTVSPEIREGAVAWTES